MEFDRLLRVIEITLPIFALIGLGKLLHRRRILRQEHTGFINWLVAYICLPALLFKTISTKDFAQLANPTIIAGALIPTALLFLGMLVFCKVRGLRGGIVGVLLASGYWGNSAYVGFPLVENAYGPEGLTYAAVVNAFAMPVFIISGSIAMALTSGHGDEMPLSTRIRKALTNPIILASFGGLLVSGLLSAGDGRTLIAQSPLLLCGARVLQESLNQIGKMGLPLALLVVGTSIRLSTLDAHKGLLTFTCALKLIVAPLLTLLCMKVLFPETASIACNSAVIIMAMPTAVAFSIISRNLDAEPDFTASMLVLSTLGALVTIPVWLYILL